MNWYFEVQPISKVDTVPCGHQLWHEQPSVKQQWCPGQSRTLLSLPGGLLFWYPEPTEGCRDHQGFWGEDREVFYCRLLFSGGFSLIVSFRAGTNWSPDFACHSPFPSSHSLETDPLLQFFKPNGNLILTSLNKGGWDPGCLQIQGPEKHLPRTSCENGVIACCPEKPIVLKPWIT